MLFFKDQNIKDVKGKTCEQNEIQLIFYRKNTNNMFEYTL